MEFPKKRKVLIVEDELPLRDGLGDKLAGKGFEVLKAANGKEGLNVALNNHPDIILLDVLMPEMDGIAMLKTLREDVWGKDAKVILWSNSKNLQKEDEGRSLHVLAFWIKSDFNFTEVSKKIIQYLL